MTIDWAQRIVVQSPEELYAIVGNPRFQPYPPDLQRDGVIGEMYGMRIQVPEEVVCRSNTKAEVSSPEA